MTEPVGQSPDQTNARVPLSNLRMPRTAAGLILLSHEDYNSRSFALITAEDIVAIEDEAATVRPPGDEAGLRAALDALAKLPNFETRGHGTWPWVSRRDVEDLLHAALAAKPDREELGLGCRVTATWDAVGAPVRVTRHDHDEDQRCPLGATRFASAADPTDVDELAWALWRTAPPDWSGARGDRPYDAPHRAWAARILARLANPNTGSEVKGKTRV